MIKGFREFIMRGNVIDMAIGIIIGAAFTPIVTAISDMLMNIIAGLIGAPNFDSVLQFSINDAVPILRKMSGKFIADAGNI